MRRFLTVFFGLFQVVFLTSSCGFQGQGTVETDNRSKRSESLSRELASDEGWERIEAGAVPGLEGIYLWNGGTDCLIIEAGEGGLRTENICIVSRDVAEWEVSGKDGNIRLWKRVGEGDYRSEEKYTLLPSSESAGDWDLAAYFDGYIQKWVLGEDASTTSVLDSPIPSFLHRVDDPSIVRYFKGLPTWFTLSLKNQSASEELLRIAGELIAAHPDDPFVCRIYFDALVRNNRIEELGQKCALWSPRLRAGSNPLCDRILRRAEFALEALQLTNAGKNAYDFLSPLNTLNWNDLLNAFPDILTYEKYREPISLVDVPLGERTIREIQVIVKTLQTEVFFKLLEGNPRKAMELASSSYRLGQLLDSRENYPITQLIGMSLREIACRALSPCVLDWCNTTGDIEETWKQLEVLEKYQTEPGQDLTMWTDEGASAYIDSYITEVPNRRQSADTRFENIRFAGAVRHRLIESGDFPKTPNDLAPLLPQGPPKDPFGDGPLRMKRDSDSVIVYGIGPDGADNGAMIEYDTSNGTMSAGDISFRIPRERKYPFPRDGVKARTAMDLMKQFPNGLPPDPFARPAGSPRRPPLSVTNTRPVYVYSHGPDQDGTIRGSSINTFPYFRYDPTNGTTSLGDIYIEIPE